MSAGVDCEPSANPVPNPVRGEASLMIGGRARLLRPSFGALIAAEEELGPLLALVDRAASGQLRLAEIAALFWHCLDNRQAIARETLGDAVLELGLARAMEPLRVLIGQILQGAG